MPAAMIPLRLSGVTAHLEPDWREAICPSGHVTLGTDQAFYSWAFYSDGQQVAFHTGPMHFEQISHCELHDIKSGRRLAEWDGDLQSSDRPNWVSGLQH
jgi:hypothetical protein